MPGQYSAVSYPHQNKEGVHINICPQTIQVQPPLSPDLNSLHLYLRGQLKSLVYLAPTGNEETLNQGMFYASQIIRICAETFPSVRHSMIRCVHERIDTKGAYFEHCL